MIIVVHLHICRIWQNEFLSLKLHLKEITMIMILLRCPTEQGFKITDFMQRSLILEEASGLFLHRSYFELHGIASSLGMVEKILFLFLHPTISLALIKLLHPITYSLEYYPSFVSTFTISIFHVYWIVVLCQIK